MKRGKTPTPGWVCATGIPLCLVFGVAYGECFAPIRQMLRPCADLPREAYERQGIEYGWIDKDGIQAVAGKNLVIVFLESFENTLLDESRFPGLVPNLQRFSGEGVVFSNIDNAPNADYTFVGLYAAVMGIPLVPQQIFDLNFSFKPEFGQRLPSLFSILNRAGYRQFFGKGVNLAFSSTDVFLKRERVDEALAFDRACPERLPEHFDGWGCPDRLLFEWGLEKYTELSGDGRPFSLTLLNVDSHAPTGYVHADSPAYSWQGTAEERQMLRAIHSADHWLGRFIAALKKTEAWPNTCVLITSDHLVPPNHVLYPALTGNPNRRHVAIVLNSGYPAAGISTAGDSCDKAPTILHMAGVRHNYQFPVGRNLCAKITARKNSSDAAYWDALAAYTNRFSVKTRTFSDRCVAVRKKQFWEIVIGGKPYSVPLPDREYPFAEKLLVLSLNMNCSVSRMGYYEDFDDFRTQHYAVLFGQGKCPLWKNIGIAAAGDEWILAVKEKEQYRVARNVDMTRLSLGL